MTTKSLKLRISRLEALRTPPLPVVLYSKMRNALFYCGRWYPSSRPIPGLPYAHKVEDAPQDGHEDFREEDFTAICSAVFRDMWEAYPVVPGGPDMELFEKLTADMREKCGFSRSGMFDGGRRRG